MDFTFTTLSSNGGITESVELLQGPADGECVSLDIEHVRQNRAGIFLVGSAVYAITPRNRHQALFVSPGALRRVALHLEAEARAKWEDSLEPCPFVGFDSSDFEDAPRNGKGGRR